MLCFYSYSACLFVHGCFWRGRNRRGLQSKITFCAKRKQKREVFKIVIVEDIDDNSSKEDEELGENFRYTISSYGADYPVDGLVKRVEAEDVYVPPFQRGFVWSHVQASRFIESLLLGLPVPGIFLFKEPDTQKLVVVDGQQRLRSLEYFYSDVIRGKEFSLRGVSESMSEWKYKSLNDGDRRRLDDAIIHATIFQQDAPERR